MGVNIKERIYGKKYKGGNIEEEIYKGGGFFYITGESEYPSSDRNLSGLGLSFFIHLIVTDINNNNNNKNNNSK